MVGGTPLAPEDFIEFLILLRTRDDCRLAVPELREGLRPPAVGRLLASKSCRYAIMFGDPLTYEQCVSLIDGLGEERKKSRSFFLLCLDAKQTGVHQASVKSRSIARMVHLSISF